MQLKFELRYDAKISAAAANRPIQIGITIRVDLPYLAVRRNDLDTHEVVYG